MNDQQREMRALAMFKSIWEGISHSLADNPEEIWARVSDYAKRSMDTVEKYSKVASLPLNPQKTAPGTHLSDELVSKGFTTLKTPGENRKVITGVSFVTEKEYKPGKFRYGVKDSEGTWYSSFFKNHCDIAKKARLQNKKVNILYEVGEYNGKPQYTIQSIEIAGSHYLRPDEVEEVAETVEVGD